MGFTEVASLDTDSTITLGGRDKKSGKPNPKSVEGYFLGTRTIGPNKFNKSKTDYMHIFQTSTGNVGVWGKTNMDQKMANVTPGVMARVTFTGERDVGKGNPMQVFKVEVDATNTIEVSGLETDNFGSQDDDSADCEGYEESDLDAEEAPLDEQPPARPIPQQRRAAAPPSASREAEVKRLLGQRKGA